MKKWNLKEMAIIVLAICLCLFGIVFLDKVFSSNISSLTQEIFSAVLASIFTVAAMTIVISFQSKQEKEKEYASRIFEKKIEIYQDLLRILFTSDDDNILTDEEIQSIENKIGEASIVANAKLVSCFSQFMIQLKVYGCLYPRSMRPKQIDHYINFFIENDLLSNSKKRHQVNSDNFEKLFVSIDDLLQEIREDLNVVEGDIKKCVTGFVSMPIDKFKMKRNPNIID